MCVGCHFLLDYLAQEKNFLFKRNNSMANDEVSSLSWSLEFRGERVVRASYIKNFFARYILSRKHIHGFLASVVSEASETALGIPQLSASYSADFAGTVLNCAQHLQKNKNVQTSANRKWCQIYIPYQTPLI
jgi:hypothetical protein